MINEHYTPEAVILANGEYPTCPVPLTMLEEASFVACCDGAANEYISRGHTPDVIVGDGDSLSTEYHKRFSLLYIRYPIRKRTTRLKPSGICKREDSENCHCRSDRQTGRPYIGKYQPTAGLYEKRHGSTDHY